MGSDEKSKAPIQRTLPDDLKHLPPKTQKLLLEVLNNPSEPINYPEPMLPHWKACPNIPWPSIGWRMGGGEGYDIDFLEWFYKLPSDARKQYIKDNQEPNGWDGFWKRVEEYCERMNAQSS